ncbi:DUF6221 family protein [Nonomuraea sp. NPDC050663]|uniref:DUF6221 family protein n=1 Tax=Nonomuraea sp. NPDC050663 TaxID=3364370 RepID=UPI0037ADA958
MNELVEFMKVRLDEEERAALAWPEDQRTWKAVGGKSTIRYSNGRSENFRVIDVAGDGFLGWDRIMVARDLGGLVEHIAVHDPARVLREVAAKRKLLADYEHTVRLRDEAAARVEDVEEGPMTRDFMVWENAVREVALLERWLEQLAAPYLQAEGQRGE